MMQVAESGKWYCNMCRWERVRLLEEKLQNTLLETEDLKQKNKRMEKQLRVTAEGRGEIRFRGIMMVKSV